MYLAWSLNIIALAFFGVEANICEYGRKFCAKDKRFGIPGPAGTIQMAYGVNADGSCTWTQVERCNGPECCSDESGGAPECVCIGQNPKPISKYELECEVGRHFCGNQESAPPPDGAIYECQGKEFGDDLWKLVKQCDGPKGCDWGSDNNAFCK